MKKKVRPLMLTATIISVILFVILIFGSFLLAGLAAIFFPAIAGIYYALAILSIAGLVFAIIGIVASTKHGSAYKKKRWAIIVTACLDIILGILGLIGSAVTSLGTSTVLVYIVVLAAGIVLIIDFVRANRVLDQEIEEENHTPSQGFNYNPNAFNPAMVPTPTNAFQVTPMAAPIQPAQPVQSAPEQKPLREKLLEAKALFDEGLLTEQEYVEKKRILLANSDK